MIPLPWFQTELCSFRKDYGARWGKKWQDLNALLLCSWSDILHIFLVRVDHLLWAGLFWLCGVRRFLIAQRLGGVWKRVLLSCSHCVEQRTNKQSYLLSAFPSWSISLTWNQNNRGLKLTTTVWMRPQFGSDLPAMLALVSMMLIDGTIARSATLVG